MEPLTVLVITPSFNRSVPHADAEVMRRIRAVSPEIKVLDGSMLVMAELHGDTSGKAELDALLAQADILFGFMPPQNITTRAPRLKWYQAASAGLDRHRDTDIWQSKVTLTGVSGMHTTPIGEFVMGLMLLFAKNTLLSFKMQQTRKWERYTPGTLRGKTVGIVGLGHIGREVARLSQAFGMRVIATRRSAQKAGKARNVRLLLPQNRIKDMLAESDYVVLCCPLTPETHHLIGEAELEAMKSTACIINIGRGSLIDEQALIKALEQKRIGGAGLDVTEAEPLPPESPLWRLDNVIISPHVSGSMENYMVRAADIFCDNLRRYIEGKKLLNIVDRKRGY